MGLHEASLGAQAAPVDPQQLEEPSAVACAEGMRGMLHPDVCMHVCKYIRTCVRDLHIYIYMSVCTYVFVSTYIFTTVERPQLLLMYISGTRACYVRTLRL